MACLNVKNAGSATMASLRNAPPFASPNHAYPQPILGQKHTIPLPCKQQFRPRLAFCILACHNPAPASLRGAMIALLARFFRGLHLIIGISAPPPGQNDRAYVLTWLGITLFVIGFAFFLLYAIPHLYFAH